MAMTRRSFTQTKGLHAHAGSPTPREVDTRYDNLARHEKETRAALDRLRQCGAQLERLLSVS